MMDSGAGVMEVARARRSVVSSTYDLGDIMSRGLRVDGAASEPNREGYISPGVERRDSAGEFSNLRLGDGV